MGAKESRARATEKKRQRLRQRQLPHPEGLVPVYAESNQLLNHRVLLPVYFQTIPPYQSVTGQSLTGLNALQWFVTTGDAAFKSKQLLRDLQDYRRQAIPLLLSEDPSPERIEYGQLIEKNLAGCCRLLADLELIRSGAVHLQCELHDGVPVIMRKNPRARGLPDQI